MAIPITLLYFAAVGIRPLRGPSWQGRRRVDRSTGMATAYWTPSGGMLLRSWTTTAVVPTYVKPAPSPQSAQKATYSLLPAEQRLPE